MSAHLPSAFSPPAQGGASLVELGGERVRVRLGELTRIGRDPDSDVCAPDPMVSPRHAEIRRTSEGAYRLVDLSSRRGTFVSSRRVSEVLLQDGEEILVGMTRWRFEQGRVGVAPPATAVLSSGAQVRRRISVATDARYSPAVDIQGQDELRLNHDKLRAAFELTRTIGVENEPAALLERILDAIFQLFKADRATALLLDPSGQIVSQVARRRTGERDEIAISSSILGEVVSTRAGVLTADAGLDSRFQRSESICVQRIRSAMCIPMLYRDELLGVLHIDSQGAANAFTERDLELLDMVATQAALALKNATLTHRVQSIVVQERKRLERVVHALPSGIVLLDDDRRVVMTNERADELLPLLGSTRLGDVLATLGSLALQDLLDQRESAQEVVLAGPPARVFLISVSDATAEGAATHETLVVISDVTEQRAAEARSNQLRDAEFARRTVESAHASARVVLDNVAQGLVIAGRDGHLDRERSQAIDRWFGEPGDTLFDLFAPIAPRFAEWLRLGYGDLFEDLLPRECVLDQLPSKFVLADRHFAVSYRPIEDAGAVARVLLVISDVTEAVLAERAEEEQRELVSLAQLIMQDKALFLDSLQEMRARLDKLLSGGVDQATARRELHTLKGNAGIFGFIATARLCHELEDKLACDDGTLEESDHRALRAHWDDVERRVKPLLGDDDFTVRLSPTEYDDVLSAAQRGEPYPAMVTRIRGWANEPTSHRLGVYARQARALAERLGKGQVTVRIDDGGLRLRRERFRGLWANLGHVVRNAVDHGLEGPDERRACGKSPAGEIVLSTRVEQGALVIEVADDGRGIDWSRVESSARQRGLPTGEARDLVAAIFTDGLSTRDEVTDVSGRGVGLAAARASVADLGGRVDVVSIRGQGTRFIFRVPVEPLRVSS